MVAPVEHLALTKAQLEKYQTLPYHLRPLP
jgi:hypothetical protein